jgi:sirohydrochlorin cobaltochelatase
MAVDAIILFGHGSRDPQWHQPMLDIASRMRVSAPGTPVRCAYLELTEPDLPSVVAELLALGARHVRVVPLFLGMGRHAREDLPRIADELRRHHEGLTLELAPAVGQSPTLLDFLASLALHGESRGS